MGRKGENIFKRKDGRFEARYVKGYKNNRAIYGYVYDKSYSAVKKKRNNILLKLNKQNKLSNNKFSFNEWLNSLNIKDSSYNRYISLIEKHIYPYFKSYSLNDLSRELIDNFMNHELPKKGLSKNSIHDIGALLREILKYYDVNIYFKIPSKEQPEINILTEKEQKLIDNSFWACDNAYKFGIILTLYTGLRIGELCALKYKNIDLENEVIRVKSTLIRVKKRTDFIRRQNKKTEVVLSTPKSKKSIREIPINKKLLPYLKIYKKRNNNENFFLTENIRFVETRTYYNHYLKILKSINITNHSFHNLRHTFGTNCIAKGIDPKVLSIIMGHSSINITLNLYVHPTSKIKKDSIDLL